MQRRQFIKNTAVAGAGVSLTGLNLSAFAKKTLQVKFV